MRPTDVADFEVLLVGGRSGVGKTSVAYQVSEQWQAAGVAHCLIDGDRLSAAYPRPPDDPAGSALTEADLHAMWADYVAVGYRRLIYVNTVSVLERAMIVRAAAQPWRCTSTATPRTGSSASPLTDGLWPTSLPMWPVRPDGQQPHSRARSPAAGRRLLASPATIARSLIEKRRSKRVRVETSGRRARAGVDDERRGAGRRGFEVTSLTQPLPTEDVHR